MFVSGSAVMSPSAFKVTFATKRTDHARGANLRISGTMTGRNVTLDEQVSIGPKTKGRLALMTFKWPMPMGHHCCKANLELMEVVRLLCCL